MTAIILPLVVDCPMASPNEPSPIGAASQPILTVQMDTLGGQHYLAPLSVAAGIALLVALSKWPPMQDYLSGQEPPAPTKLQ